MLSTFLKWINVLEIDDCSSWLQDAKSFTFSVLKKELPEVPYSWVHYLIKFWENITFKWISSNPIYGLGSTENRQLISFVFEAYVNYLAQYEEVDGFKSSVQIEEKLIPIPILVKSDLHEWMTYMLSMIQYLDNGVKQNLLLYNSHLVENERELEKSDFWEISNINQISWIILISAEMLKAHEKVIHKKILQSKSKADVVAETFENLTINELESKISQVSKLCWGVFLMMNKFKTIQEKILNFPKDIIDRYMILERSFLSFIFDFCYLYFLWENNEDGLKIILNNISETMDFKGESEVIVYITDKLIDNLENFNDFVIRKQTKEILYNLRLGLQKEKQYNQDNLVTHIANSLICHADSDEDLNELKG